DILKTDGEYIYSLSQSTGKLNITSAGGEELEKVSVIKTTDNPLDFFITKDRLILIASVFPEPSRKQAPGQPEILSCFMISTDTRAIVYDISDKSNPEKVNELEQDGDYISSRMIGDILYLVTSNSIFGDIDKNKPETYIPSITIGGKKEILSPEDITINPKMESATYCIVSGVDTAGKGKLVSSKSPIGYSQNIYVSVKNIYITASNSIEKDNVYKEVTDIVRLSVNEGEVSFASKGTVPGYLLNQYSMDEYNDVLRVVTTASVYDANEDVQDLENNVSNGVYTLDTELNILGKEENIAPGEQIYSSRFMGDKVYFVTFQQVDPLFAVDLSDPKDIKILSALKIPGFSNYLQGYGEGQLLGLGSNADEKTGKVGFLKLSMFDINNADNISETHKETIKGHSFSEAAYNYKAILADPEKNVIAFPGESNYLIYSYSKEKGFEKMADIPINDEYYYDSARGLYIGNYFYIVSEKNISSYDMTDYAKVAELNL
ncbi:MAG: beta-propeller domain-containing protein, partial [Anaerovoracaceae bacterium]